MKKIISVALALVVGATVVFAATPDKKPKKKKEHNRQEQPQVKLVTSADSVSYAAGKALTEGVLTYLRQNFQVDSAYVGEVITGFKEAFAKAEDPQYKAFVAGQAIAKTVHERMLPDIKSRFAGTKDAINDDLFVAGFVAALAGDTTIYNNEQAKKLFSERLKTDQEEAARVYKANNENWLATNNAKPGVTTTPSGLQYKVLRKGTGAMPADSSYVRVKYEGKLIDGTVFDSSYKRTPDTNVFRAKDVIKGWTEALTMMPVGSKWELYIPAALGYGSRQAGQILPNSTLIFTVELMAIEKGPEKN